MGKANGGGAVAAVLMAGSKNENERLSMADSDWSEDEGVLLVWKQLVERLVFEEAMKQQVGRCMLFLFSFFLLLTSMYFSFPTSHLTAVHEYIKVKSHLSEAMSVTRPEQVLEFIDKYRMEYSSYIQDDAATTFTAAIMPPVVIQERYKRKDCSSFDPALVLSMRAHGDSSRINVGCNSEELESAPFVSSNPQKPFTCKSTLFGGVPVYQLPSESVNSTIPSTWIDVQTNSVTLLDVLVSPVRRCGTVLSLRWTQVHGLFRYDGEMLSYVEMNHDEQNIWMILSIVTVCLRVVELLVIACIFLSRFNRRRRWIRVARRADTEDEVLVHKQTVREAVPIVGLYEIADIVVSIMIMAFVGIRILQLYAPTLGDADPTKQFGAFSSQMRDVLVSYSAWASSAEGTDVRDAAFSTFFSSVERLKVSMDLDFFIRIWGYFLILTCFLRTICYFKVHPRMAVLYLTLSKSMNDLAHFMLVFVFLFSVLAFSSSWMFGAENKNFAGVAMASLTQFRMLLGDFSALPADANVRDAKSQIFTAYIAIYACVCFFVLLNFFLAIIIDAYVAVNQKVKECIVEQSIWRDMANVIAYPFKALYYRWPSRGLLLDSLLRENADGGLLYDADDDKMISVSEILSTGHFRGKNPRLCAESFMDKYAEFEVLQTGEEPDQLQLDHHRIFKGIQDLARMSRELLPPEESANIGMSNGSLKFRATKVIPKPNET